MNLGEECIDYYILLILLGNFQKKKNWGKKKCIGYGKFFKEQEFSGREYCRVQLLW